MRVGIDARLLGYRPAGIGTYIRSLTRSLVQLAPQDHFDLLLSRRDRNVFISAPNVTTHRMLTPAHFPAETWTLPFEMLPIRVNLLHSPDFIPPAWGLFRRVITIHDLAFRLFPGITSEETKRYYGQVDRAVQNAEAIIAVSESTKRDLIQHVNAPESRIHVIYEAADPVYHPVDRTAAMREAGLRLRIDANFILFVGTIEPRKNLELIFRAMTQSALRSVRLVIAGRRTATSDGILQMFRELQIQQRVMVLGQVDPSLLPVLYNAADLVVFPSHYEGFGLPILEAMACGTPVICSNTSSMPEVAGDAGLLLDPQDVTGWANAIRRVLDDRELWLDMQQRGLRQAAQFSWDNAAQQTLAVYHEVAGQ